MLIIQLIGTADGLTHCGPLAQYVFAFNPDGNQGFGHIAITNDPDQALKFPDFIAALNFWRQQSTVRPLRTDGQPNRPLTAYTVEFVQCA
jgi:hypothetical protein